MGRASKDKRDIYYRKAKEEGYRARSAYKLLQIHEEFNILDPAEIRTGAVDLCAAPGSWSQVLAHHFKALTQHTNTRDSNNNKTNEPSPTSIDNVSSDSSAPPAVPPRVVAVDLQEMAPIEGVRILQGDITSEATANEIIRLLNAPEEEEEGDATGMHKSQENLRENEEKQEEEEEKEDNSAEGGATGKSAAEVHGRAASTSAAAPRQAASPPSATSSSTPVRASARKADIVICDGAPDVTGMHELDEYLQHHLLLAALHITTFILRPGGCFVTKMFRGPNTPFLVAKSEVFFAQVRVVKPKSSRNASMESFLLCQGFRLPPGYVPRFMDTAKPARRGGEDETTAHSDSSKAANDGAGGCACDGSLRASNFTPDAPVYHYQSTAQDTSLSASSAPVLRSHGALRAAGAAEAPTTAASSSSSTPACSGRTACALPSSVLAPFLSCGDLSGFDADMCYDRAVDAAVLAPVQPPLQAPYLTTAQSVGAAAANATGAEAEADAEAEKNKKAKVEV